MVLTITAIFLGCREAAREMAIIMYSQGQKLLSLTIKRGRAKGGGLGEKGLQIMRKKGMLEPKVTETIRAAQKKQP